MPGHDADQREQLADSVLGGSEALDDARLLRSVTVSILLGRLGHRNSSARLWTRLP